MCVLPLRLTVQDRYRNAGFLSPRCQFPFMPARHAEHESFTRMHKSVANFSNAHYSLLAHRRSGRVGIEPTVILSAKTKTSAYKSSIAPISYMSSITPISNSPTALRFLLQI